LFGKSDYLSVKEEADMDDHKNGRKFLVTRAKEVEFIFHSPNALKVFLAGEFNSWEAESLPMQKYKEDLWEAMVNLPPGRYEYKMLVDNAWAEEPPCTVMIRGSCFKLILDGGRIPNPFGTQNYFFLVK
jgi:1,4-alpha-glucan branching enzyme